MLRIRLKLAEPTGFRAKDANNLQLKFKSRPLLFIQVAVNSTGGMPASASAGYLRSRSEKRLARPLALQVFFLGRRKVQWRDAGLGIRGGFFDSERRNGSRGRSPSRCFFRVPQGVTRGMPDSASAGVSSIQIGETAREAARPPGVFSRLPQIETGGMPASASAGFLRSRSEKRLARPLALQWFVQTT